MLALETIASIEDHRLVIQDDALPAHADRARVCCGNRLNRPDDVLHHYRWRAWEKKRAIYSQVRRQATGKCWPDAHSRHPCPLLVS